MTKPKKEISKEISLEETIQKFVESQKEMNLSLIGLLDVMKRIFNGENAHDPGVEEGDLERDLEAEDLSMEAKLQTEPDLDGIEEDRLEQEEELGNNGEPLEREGRDEKYDELKEAGFKVSEEGNDMAGVAA